jgi:hypothetical protein
MNLERKNICPLKNAQCIGLDCAWFTQLRGTHPNTGAEIDEWSCAVAWLPVLLIENAKETRQTAAAVESFRNVFAAGQELARNLLASSATPHNLLEGKPE